MIRSSHSAARSVTRNIGHIGHALGTAGNQWVNPVVLSSSYVAVHLDSQIALHVVEVGHLLSWMPFLLQVAQVWTKACFQEKAFCAVPRASLLFESWATYLPATWQGRASSFWSLSNRRVNLSSSVRISFLRRCIRSIQVVQA